MFLSRKSDSCFILLLLIITDDTVVAHRIEYAFVRGLFFAYCGLIQLSLESVAFTFRTGDSSSPIFGKGRAQKSFLIEIHYEISKIKIFMTVVIVK